MTDWSYSSLLSFRRKWQELFFVYLDFTCPSLFSTSIINSLICRHVCIYNLQGKSVLFLTCEKKILFYLKKNMNNFSSQFSSFTRESNDNKQTSDCFRSLVRNMYKTRLRVRWKNSFLSKVAVAKNGKKWRRQKCN